MAHPAFPIGTKVLVHGRTKGVVVGTDYLRALIEFKQPWNNGFRNMPSGSRDWIVYGVLEPVPAPSSES